MNQITIIGRVGQDPKSKTFNDGGAICTISVATDESYKKTDGSKVDDCQWFNVSGNGKQAEFMAKYLKKGMKIAVTGKMRSRKYESEGIQKEAWELKADRFEFIESVKHEDTGKDVPNKVVSSAYQEVRKFDDGLPF